jgi:apolipoprotein N-acyltransferase
VTRHAVSPGKDFLPGKRFKAFLCDLSLFVLSVALFTIAHPNPIVTQGVSFLAYIAFVPLFLLIRRVSFPQVFAWGGLYGIFSYCAFGYWLYSFHPLSLYLLAATYGLVFLLLFPLLKLAVTLFPRKGYLVQWALWIGYEYLKTLGFAGFPYGIIGYTQWAYPPVIRIASIFGVWGVSALVAFPSAWLAAVIAECLDPRDYRGMAESWASFLRVARARSIPILVWCVAFGSALAYGSVYPRAWENSPRVTIALVQPNTDPWLGGMDAYRDNFQRLARLSEEALSEHPDIALIVWPETAFIPRIDWHYRYREDRAAFELVSDFLSWVDRLPVPLLTGNDDAEMGFDDGVMDRVDYNAALLFTPRQNVIPPRPDRYRKIHLVPFTEHFPYRDAFPGIYDFLLNNDTHFWAQGTDPVVFSSGGLRFSTPICFEDSFGSLSRDAVNRGARAIVNISNDSWSKSVSCQYQHLAMSVFRAVENGVPLVRATASGQTAVIDPSGTVTAMAAPFAETALVAAIPALDALPVTPYRFWGDLWGALFVFGGTLAVLFGIVDKVSKYVRQLERYGYGKPKKNPNR